VEKEEEGGRGRVRKGEITRVGVTEGQNRETGREEGGEGEKRGERQRKENGEDW
jgi:hypothetical protein